MNRNELNKMMGLNEKQLDELARPFEEGTWDVSQYGPPRFGRPTAFGEAMKPVTFKETPTVISKMDERAKSQGKSRSDYLRALVAADLALV